MRSPRYVKGAVVAAACAALLVPAGAAYADTGAKGAESTKPSAAGNPNSAKAKAAGVCDDATETGERDLIQRDGETIASVKQFYSLECGEYYGYVWVWDSFRDSAEPYDVTAGVYQTSDETVHGKTRLPNTKEQEIWSEPYSDEECTMGYGALSPGDDPRTYEGFSERDCEG